MKNPSRVLWALHVKTEPIDWETVYTLELPRVYNFFLYRITDKDAAQDLTAITFERAWEHRVKYRSTIAALSTWLFGIARNVLKEYLRSDRRNKQRSASIVNSRLLTSDIEVENSIVGHQEKEYLHKILLELPDRKQDLIALRYGAGLTNREIAKITGLSESNVGSILFRTVKSLRQKWEDSHGR